MQSRETNSDIEDVEDVLRKIELSYGIKFQSGEMTGLKTFGEIAYHIISKINLEEDNNCTAQQAFYKLKSAIVSATEISGKEILPSTGLENLFRCKRRKKIALIEKELGLRLNAFCIPRSTVITLLSILLISIIVIFFNWEYGLFGIIITILSMKLIDLTTTKFSEKTIGELAKSMMYDNYIQSRRNPGSVNKAEIKKNLEGMFIKELGMSNKFKKLTDDIIIIN